MKTKIGEKKFKSEPLKGSLAMKLGYNWGRKFYGPFITVLQNTFQNLGEFGDIDLTKSSFMDLALVFLKSGSAEGLKDLMDKIEYEEILEFLAGKNLDGCEGGLFANTKVLNDDEYVSIDFDRDFSGNLEIAFQLAWWVLGLNFPFIQKVKSLSGMEEEPQNQKESL